jgi:hypothetical protein
LPPNKNLLYASGWVLFSETAVCPLKEPRGEPGERESKGQANHFHSGFASQKKKKKSKLVLCSFQSSPLDPPVCHFLFACRARSSAARFCFLALLAPLFLSVAFWRRDFLTQPPAASLLASRSRGSPLSMPLTRNFGSRSREREMRFAAKINKNNLS